MIPIRTIIVDDVELARERLRHYLGLEPDIEIVGEARNGAEAVRMISTGGPELVFLDVELPDFDGFQIARRLPPGIRPAIVYITAHEDRAISAFEVDALDYLLKPFDGERFAAALNRVRSRIRGAPRAESFLQRLAVREKGRTEIVPVAEIDYIEIAGHYLCVHVGRAVYLVRAAIADLEARLDPAEFARIHRSALVRLSRVKSLATRTNGDCDVILADGTRLLMSRSYREMVRRRLGITEF